MRYTRSRDGKRYPLPIAAIRLINPGLLAIILHRYVYSINRLCQGDNRKMLRRLLKASYHIGRKIVMAWGKIHISEATEFGPGLYLSGKGGIIIGSRSIGRNFTAEHNVTIGMGINNETPIIGDNVVVRHDSVIYGDIKVGSGSVIDAESVLSKTIPEKSLVKGNPARIIKRPIEFQDYV